MSDLAIVDASAVVSTLCDAGSEGAWAASVIDHSPLVAPALLMFEATNALRRLELGGVIEPPQAAMAFADLNAVRVHLWPYPPLADRIWDLRETVTSYDAAYVALAELLDAPLITLDRRLAKARGPRCAILDTGDERVLAHRCDWLEGTVLAVHNLCGDEVEARLELHDGDRFEDLADIFGNQRFEPLELDRPTFRLPPYSYRWLRARAAGSRLPL